MEKHSTRQLILEAAVDMFAEKGFANVSTRQLAERVGIRSASLYYHFASKEDILSAIFEAYRYKLFLLLSYPSEEALKEDTDGQSIEEVADHLLPPLPADDSDYIVKITRISLQEQFSDPRLGRFWQEMVIKVTVKRWKYLLDLMVADGRLPPMNTLMAAETTIRVLVSYLFELAHYRRPEDTACSASFTTARAYLIERTRRGDF